MPAELWKSLTVRIMALGHPLREAECIAAAIVIDCLAMYTIMGYRFSDAERERSTATWYGPETCPMTRPVHCGTVPECVDRDGIFFHCQLNPAWPGSREEWNGFADLRGISSPGIVQDAAPVGW
jgi:hypothetical protein